MLLPLTVTLPRIVSPYSIAYYERVVKKMKRLSADAGSSSRGFQERVQQFKLMSEQGQDVATHIHSLVDIRAVIHLWSNDSEFLSDQPLMNSVFDQFRNVSSFASRLGLLGLVSLYFDKYDLLNDGITVLRDYLLEQFHSPNRRPVPPRLQRFSDHIGLLLDPYAPKRLVDFGIKKELPLQTIVQRCGIPNGKSNRFHYICQNLYYVESLKELVVGEDTPIFAEIMNPKVYGAAYNEKQLLGHMVLQILLDKCIKAGELPDNWRDVILSIAKDPRVPTGNKHFRQWWAITGAERTEWMRQQLSGFDLKVFLEILEDYAKNSGKDDLRRMFPARKRFLEGLFEMGLVEHSRLFLGNAAINFLRQNYHEDVLPHYAQQSDSAKAIIHLDLGTVHLIEGSHVFPIILLDRIPSDSKIQSYEEDFFIISKLNRSLRQQHDRERIRNGGVENDYIKHSRNLNWQFQVLKAMREKYNLVIHPSDVLTERDYKAFINKPKYSL